jgi:hypothetical protein
LTDDSPIAGISRDIHTRVWQLPEETQRRQGEARRQSYNRRMRAYMREYRCRRCRHTILLHQHEETRLRQEVKKHGYRPATLLRHAAFAYFDGGSVVPRDIGDRLDAAIAAINRIGNNINQLAFQANTRRKATHREVQEARRLLRDLSDTVRRSLAPPAAPSRGPRPPA